MPSHLIFLYNTERAAQPLWVMPYSLVISLSLEKSVNCRLSYSKVLLHGKICLCLKKVPLWLSGVLRWLFTCILKHKDKKVPLWLSAFFRWLFTGTFWQYNQESSSMTLRIFALTFYLYISTWESKKCCYDSPDFRVDFLLVNFNILN